MQKMWAVLFGVVLAAEFLLFPLSYVLGWWLPKDVSSTGGGIDFLFYGILAITGVFFLLVEALLVYAMFAFIADPKRKVPFIHGILSLELAWSTVPAAILIIIGLWQINVWAEVKYPNRIAEHMTQEKIAKNEVQVVSVTARQWEWRIRYPDVDRVETWKTNPRRADRFYAEPMESDIRGVNELHVWKGANVVVQLSTQDVIHSFFLPNLRVKQDALPGKTIPVWFVATEANTTRVGDRWEDGRRYSKDTQKWDVDHTHVWELACAEFCGTRHSLMRGKLYVHDSRDDFLAWLKTAQDDNQRHQIEP